jgi:hypothetical protein
LMMFCVFQVQRYWPAMRRYSGCKFRKWNIYSSLSTWFNRYIFSTGGCPGPLQAFGYPSRNSPSENWTGWLQIRYWTLVERIASSITH